MSSIEAIQQFFENIRPRYSWSSSESIPEENSLCLSPAHDAGEVDIQSSPPSSPMSDVDTVVAPEINPFSELETDCSHEQRYDIDGTLRNSSASAMAVSNNSSGLGITPNGASMMSPMEGPAYSTSRMQNSQVQQNDVPDSLLPHEALLDPSSSAHSISSNGQLLAEDDGHRLLREKVIEIQHMDISERERAQRMHLLMTERYLASQNGFRRRSISSGLIEAAQMHNPLKLGPDDVTPSYHDAEEGILGCEHYCRGVKIQCSSCWRWYPCRFCHDEVEDHSLIRKDTKNMLCMSCGKAQSAQQSCRFCGERTARYYCDKCKLWDDDPHKTIYHCNDCGICRIGMGLGKDFFHCKKCGVCMSIELEGQHRCIERSTDCDCPICGEYMFTSIMTVVFMTCGHSIHHKCYNEHMKTSYRCPTCARSVLNMETQFRFLDHEIARQPLPEPYRYWHCHITCNDCSAKGDVPFHFLGLKCSNCKSYNTCEVRLIRPEDESEDPLARNPLPPAHLMPNPDMAATIMTNRNSGAQGVVTDLASVIREIDMASVGTYTPQDPSLPRSHEQEFVDDDDENDTTSCDTCDIVNKTHEVNENMEDVSSDEEDEEDNIDAVLAVGVSTDVYDDEEYEDEEEDDEEDDDDGFGGYEIIRLPFHP